MICVLNSLTRGWTPAADDTWRLLNEFSYYSNPVDQLKRLSSHSRLITAYQILFNHSFHFRGTRCVSSPLTFEKLVKVMTSLSLILGVLSNDLFSKQCFSGCCYLSWSSYHIIGRSRVSIFFPSLVFITVMSDGKSINVFQTFLRLLPKFNAETLDCFVSWQVYTFWQSVAYIKFSLYIKYLNNEPKHYIMFTNLCSHHNLICSSIIP